MAKRIQMKRMNKLTARTSLRPFVLMVCLFTLCQTKEIPRIPAGFEGGDKLHAQTGKTSTGESLFEGDLVVTFHQISENYGLEFAMELDRSGFVFVEPDGPEDESRALAVLKDGLWPDRREGKVQIAYQIDNIPHYDEESQRIIKGAMEELETSGVLKFVERTTESDFLFFTLDPPSPEFPVPTDACYTRGVGYISGQGPKVLNLGFCNKQYWSIVHELMHALGFWHEQSRPDREFYVSVNETLLEDVNYQIRSASEIDSLGSPYDFDSLMHYSLESCNLTCVAMRYRVEPEPYTYIGQRWFISKHDMDQIRSRYQCTDGAREGPIAPEDYCTENCPCWENALGECSSDDECQGDLICGDPVQPPAPEPLEICEVDLAVDCNDFVDFCGNYSVISRVFCRKTCNIPCYPVEEIVLPDRMCVNTTSTTPPTTPPTREPMTLPTPVPSVSPTTSPTTRAPVDVSQPSPSPTSEPPTFPPTPMPEPTLSPTPFPTTPAPVDVAQPSPLPTTLPPDPTVPPTRPPSPTTRAPTGNIIIRPPIGLPPSSEPTIMKGPPAMSPTPAPVGNIIIRPPIGLPPSSGPTIMKGSPATSPTPAPVGNIIIRPPIGSGSSPPLRRRSPDLETTSSPPASRGERAETSN